MAGGCNRMGDKAARPLPHSGVSGLSRETTPHYRDRGAGHRRCPSVLRSPRKDCLQEPVHAETVPMIVDECEAAKESHQTGELSGVCRPAL
jgi:hypothetical protein